MVKEKGKNFYLYIYREICKGRLPNDIRKDIDFSPQNMTYYLRYLHKKVKIIEPRDKNNRWLGWKVLQSLTEQEFIQLQEKVKEKGKRKSSIGTNEDYFRPTINLHALHIKFPIMKGKVKDQDWDEIQKKFNNWLPKYKKEKALGGLTLKNNNNKSISVYVHPRDYDDLELNFEEKLAFKVKVYMEEYFRLKHNVRLDIFNAETKNIDMAKEAPILQDKLRKGEKFKYKLGVKATKLFPNDNLDAEVWMDSSPRPNTIETNHIEYKEDFILSPIRIKEIHRWLPLLAEYNRNLELHIQVQKENLETQKEIQRTQKELQKLLENMK